MANTFLDNITLKKVFLDNVEVKKLFLDNVLVWSSGPPPSSKYKMKELYPGTYDTMKTLPKPAVFDGYHIAEMFGGCFSLASVGDLSKWNTSNVTDMSDMFHGCASLTSVGDLSKWNTSNVTDMSHMFHGCVSLTSVNCTFDLSSITSESKLKYMFKGTKVTKVTFKKVSATLKPKITKDLLGLPSNATISFV